jgi:hypothetical protein
MKNLIKLGLPWLRKAVRSLLDIAAVWQGMIYHSVISNVHDLIIEIVKAALMLLQFYTR